MRPTHEAKIARAKGQSCILKIGDRQIGTTKSTKFHEAIEAAGGDADGLSFSLGGSLTGGGKFQIADRFQHWHDGIMKLKAIVHEAEEGGFWAEVPALPGCFTQGESLEELEVNIAEAIEAWLLAAEPQDGIQDGRVLEVAV
jgi:predicted RNase H-like HicB family nuclease